MVYIQVYLSHGSYERIDYQKRVSSINSWETAGEICGIKFYTEKVKYKKRQKRVISALGFNTDYLC